MEVRIIHDTSMVYEFLKNKERYDYVYQLNNLEASQWKQVVCYGLFYEEELKAIAMLNMNYGIPVLLAASFDDVEYSIKLIRKIKPFLPPKFYTHIDKATLAEVFPEDKITGLEEYMNMGIWDFYVLNKMQENEAVRVGFKSINEIKYLLSVGHPGAWLDEELVMLNENFGMYVNRKLVSFAGIHAYSNNYEVAAIAHVTTHPEYRKRGYGEQVVSALVNSLKGKIKFIGLNVKTDNVPAINCYKKLGFEEFGRFMACDIEIKMD
ncbi:GNAT family N-acetyltransferase [Clostridium sp.]|uniref:GNAT family N-acetyltransferase n=1 Tax=Clostridium sp. TaxID=1506 RepID=UPI002FCA4111